MLFHGNGCYKNKDKAHEYFDLAESNGSMKCEKYFIESTDKFKTVINSPYKKSVDVVFMIDGTESMSQYMELDDLSEFCNDVIQKLLDEFPKVFVRFSVILYKDAVVTTNINNSEKEEVDQVKKNKLLFIRKQINNGNDNNKEVADDKVQSDNSSDDNNNNKSIDKSDSNEKEKIEIK